MGEVEVYEGGARVVDMDGFDRRLRLARLRRDVSQAELAAEIGMTKAGYNRLERGKSRPSVPTGGRLAQALGVDLKWLLFGDERSMPTEDAWWKERVEPREDEDR